MAEHSMCQPGRPGPRRVSQDGSPSLRVLPQGEIVDALLLVLVGLAARPGLQPVQVDLGQPAVAGELGDAEIDGAVLLVGVALFEQALDDCHHLRDVLGRPGIDVGRLRCSGS